MTATQNRSYEGIKRAGDWVAAVLLLIIFSPLFLVVSVLIVAGSPGGVFFRQTRTGKDGRQFRIIKFRSMIADAEAIGPHVTAANDFRMTRLGRVLRATKIDELPQLINVLAGDMSLVGPRPQVPKYVALFPSELREEILSVPPGITGPTAIRFRHEEQILDNRPDREEFYVDVLLPMKCSLDVQYVRTRGLLTDLHSLLATLALFTRGIFHRVLRRPIGTKIELDIDQQAVINRYCTERHVEALNFGAPETPAKQLVSTEAIK